MKIDEKLKKLSNSFGIGNNYKDVTNTIIGILGNENMSIDINDNIIYNLRGNLEPNTDYTKIMLDAHIDEIGFIVTSITDEGFIKLSNVGGVDKRLLLSQKVLILGKNPILGVVSCVAPHLSDKIGNKDEYINIDKMFIDIGMTKENALNVISVGDFCVFNQQSKDMVDDLITGKSLDNRVGCVTLMEVYTSLKNDIPTNLDIYFCFTTKEELSGAVGASCISFNLEPHISIVVDVSFAKAPNVEDYKCGKMRDGVMIGFAPILDKGIYDTMICIAKNNNIKHQIEIMNNRTGTNADGIISTKNGVKTCLLSIPIKNMHSVIEVVAIEDIIETKKLIVEYLKVVN